MSVFHSQENPANALPGSYQGDKVRDDGLPSEAPAGRLVGPPTAASLDRRPGSNGTQLLTPRVMATTSESKSKVRLVRRTVAGYHRGTVAECSSVTISKTLRGRMKNKQTILLIKGSSVAIPLPTPAPRLGGTDHDKT